MAEEPVLILTGAPGAGKTTTARILVASAERAVHLESDAFFHFIQTGYVEPWKPESQGQNKVVMRIVGEAAAAYANAGYFTIIDGIVSPRWFFEPLRDSLQNAGLMVAYAVLRPPLAVCRSRAVMGESGQPADPAVVGQLWEEFADLGSLERHAVDTETEGAAEVAATTAQRLRDGQLTA
jgi:tRNA uridine 5-carbamoylmethylation protein Kti12